eukprot:TRINITY_DN61517_c0_g1_i1.p2 TRINITY_DN61517_c0_g1~~TRINITY_DN61517_c0_g1_i1.p2  ORF type:complete len:286 (+),score=102.19 TRINITY_DN61517_c0_g1_i1:85-858(+)
MAALDNESIDLSLPARAFQRCRKVPSTMIVVVVVAWLGVGGSCLMVGMLRRQRDREWSDAALPVLCNVTHRTRAAECNEGPGAGGGGYRYLALSVEAACFNVSLWTSADCGEDTLGGRGRFLEDSEDSAAVVTLSVTRCLVSRNCSAIELTAAFEARRRTSIMLFIIGAAVMLPLGLVLIALVPFSCVALFRACSDAVHDFADLRSAGADLGETVRAMKVRRSGGRASRHSTRSRSTATLPTFDKSRGVNRLEEPLL